MSAPDRTVAIASSARLHLAGLIVLSAAFEAMFLQHGLNPVDEAWPLYAAMQLEAGGQLYGDTFFVFPPGHLLCAWLGRAISPPGVIWARMLYGAFNVALVAASYLLARRLMPPAAALLGAGLIAVAASDSHGSHYLFGYRYLVFSVLALLCFAERLRADDRRWMFAAGALAGVALLFRLTPAFAAVAGIAAGVVARDPRPRSVWEDGSRAAVGFLAVTVPLVVWFAAGVGLEKLWLEAVVRPIAMTDLQSLPVPPLALPAGWHRALIRRAFVPVQFWLYSAMYIGFAIALGGLLLRSLRERRPFEPVLLLAVVTWAGLYFLRSFGRSDEAHLDSTVPASLLVLAYAVSLPLRGALTGRGVGRAAAHLVLVAIFALWGFLTVADWSFRRWLGDYPGWVAVRSLDGATHQAPRSRFRHFDEMIRQIRIHSEPGDVILDLTATSMLHVVSGRRGPGHADVIMPGTFLDEAEEQAFVARLEASSPPLVVVPRHPFDNRPSRHLSRFAPLLTDWVSARYEASRVVGPWVLMLPIADEKPAP